VLTGALPVFAEVDESLAIDPSDFEAKITPQTKAVMVVQPEGVPADMDRIMSIARKHKVKVSGGRRSDLRRANIRASASGRLAISASSVFQMHKLLSAGEGRRCL